MYIFFLTANLPLKTDADNVPAFSLLPVHTAMHVSIYVFPHFLS